MPVRVFDYYCCRSDDIIEDTIEKERLIEQALGRTHGQPFKTTYPVVLTSVFGQM